MVILNFCFATEWSVLSGGCVIRSFNSAKVRFIQQSHTKYKSAHEARDAYQIFYEKGNPDSWSDARLLGEFDTLQLYKNGVPQVQVPLANGGRGPGYELFTSAYPEYGKGGALQLLPIERNYPVIFERVTIIPE
ncbi:hypothetical protein ACVXG7_15465 [Enterobacter hormaechei]